MYTLRIESTIKEVGPFHLPKDTYNLDGAVKAAERYKSRVWVLNAKGETVARWDGLGRWKTP